MRRIRKHFIAVASILDRTVLRGKYVYACTNNYELCMTPGLSLHREHFHQVSCQEQHGTVKLCPGTGRQEGAVHHAGVIIVHVPGYRRELGLLLLSRGWENMFGTQVILLGASCYSLVCCDGKWPRSTSITWEEFGCRLSSQNEAQVCHQVNQ